ncbi:hypothetical protein CO100_02460, partial [Candidatus Berkelbacteria bacterium CG_4_9_14_3_um_filter_33_5]
MGITLFKTEKQKKQILISLFVLIIALVLIIGLLLVGNGLTMYYLYQKNDQPINDEKELVNQAVNERLNEG